MGNLDIKIYNFSEEDYLIKKGDKFAQGVLKKKISHKFKKITKKQFDKHEQKARGYWGSSGKQ
jgi:dUTPase